MPGSASSSASLAVFKSTGPLDSGAAETRAPRPRAPVEVTRSDRVEVRDASAVALLTVTRREILRIVASEVRNRSLLVTTRITPVLTVGDPALLERVVGNLVENAVRHNLDGGWLEVCTDRVGPQARLRVSSSGEPIARDAVAALFEPFHRSGVARTSHEGSGLGLSIVRAVVTAHAGTVHAEPVPGGGLTVTVHLPAA